MVINATAARTIWGSDDPLTTPVARDSFPINVVGVVGDVRYEDIEAEPKPAIFFPVAQMTRSRAMLFVRTAGDPASLAAVVRNEVKAVDRNHTVSDVQTLRQRMFEATASNRFATQVLSAFAATALLLAAIGIYGVLSLAVAQRRRELGIRMALGAERRGVLTMILGQAMSLAAVGGLIGAVGALMAGRALGTMLYGVTAADPVTYVVLTIVLGVVPGGGNRPAQGAVPSHFHDHAPLDSVVPHRLWISSEPPKLCPIPAEAAAEVEILGVLIRASPCSQGFLELHCIARNDTPLEIVATTAVGTVFWKLSPR